MKLNHAEILELNYRERLENEYLDELLLHLSNQLIMYKISKTRRKHILSIVKDILKENGGYRFHQELTRIELKKFEKALGL